MSATLLNPSIMAAGAATQTVGDLDRWHVVLSPGETKVLTLEQLDDLFRLEVIDAATKVWQPGMREWLPLSVVAGLDDDDDDDGPASATLPRGPLAKAQPAKPHPVPASAAFASPWPASSSVTSAPRLAPAVSLRPVVLAERQHAPERSGGAGRFLIGFALLASLTITLYRNGLVKDLAVSTRHEATFLSVESALGGPGFGTPRALEALAKSPVGVNVSQGQSRSAMSVGSASERTVKGPSEPARASKEAEGEAQSAAPKPRATRVSVESSATEPGPLGKRTVKARSPAKAPVREVGRSKALGIRGSSNRYDPLNGKL